MHFLLACRVSTEKSADSLMRVPLYTTNCYSLTAFKILSLSLTFGILIIMCPGLDLWVHLLWSSLGSWLWVSVSFSRLGTFSAIIYSNKFSAPFSLSSPSGTPKMWMLFHLMLSQMSLKLPLLNFVFLFATLFGWVPLPCLSNHWSVLLHPLTCCWFILMYFPFQLLYSSVLIGSFFLN